MVSVATFAVDGAEATPSPAGSSSRTVVQLEGSNRGGSDDVFT